MHVVSGNRSRPSLRNSFNLWGLFHRIVRSVLQDHLSKIAVRTTSCVRDRVFVMSKNYRRDFGGNIVVEDTEYHASDDLQTPPYALAALAPYIRCEFSTAWEPARGEGLLAQALREYLGLQVIETGIEEDFFTYDPPSPYDVQITNPPWSKKYKWLSRSLEQQRPFALLLPSKMIFAAKAICMIENSDLEIIQVYPRVAYKSVNMETFLESRPQLDSCWLTYKFQIGRRLTYTYIGDEKKRFLAELRAQWAGQLYLFQWKEPELQHEIKVTERKL